jgi:hypothetical protein
MAERTKRYHVNSKLIDKGFKPIGPFTKAVFGQTANNWQHGNIIVKRKSLYGVSYLFITKNGIELDRFNISGKNPNRDAAIERFERAVDNVLLTGATKVVVEQHTKVLTNDELSNEIDDISSKLIDIKATLDNGKKLDSTQMAFLRMHNVI